jgi:hypothetical protein
LICKNILEFRQKIFASILTLFALSNALKWGVNFVANPYQPVDFRTYYLGAKAFISKLNPYSPEEQSRLWENEKTNEKDTWQKKIGFPHAVVVYAPQFSWYFSIYALIDFHIAKWIHWVLNILSLVFIIHFLIRLLPGVNKWLLISSVFAFKGTWYAMDTGQPMLQVLAICLLSLYLIQKRGLNHMPALLLALVSFKFTLLLPLLVYLICTKKFKVVSTYIFLVMILNTLALLCVPMPVETLSSWRENIGSLWAYTHSPHIINGLNIISTSVSVPLSYFFDVPHTWPKTLNFIFLLMGYAASIYIGFKNSPKAALLLSCVTGLCFGHHLVYDLLTFICFLWILKDREIVYHPVFYLLAIILMLPLGSIASRFDMPIVHFLLPICLPAFWILLLWRYFPRRNMAIKNPN